MYSVAVYWINARPGLIDLRTSWATFTELLLEVGPKNKFYVPDMNLTCPESKLQFGACV